MGKKFFATTDNSINTLILWYKTHGRHHLPWRADHLTPYHIWISEIMLQQTQVNRVIEYFNRFIEKYPTVEDLARSDWETFLPYYQGLGYYNRGRNMLKTAHIIVEKHNSVFPENKKDLLALPGIGPYTASAILSFGYGQDLLAFDTNLQKVLGRFFHGNKKAKIDVKEIEKMTIETNNYWSLQSLPIFNAAIMDLSSLVCKNKTPQCEKCPLQDECVYQKNNGSLEASIKKNMKNVRNKNYSEDVRNKNFCSQQTILTLHSNHKEYYSSHADHYQPFELPTGVITRKDIKEYFQNTYDLNLSVRPPHKKEHTKDAMILHINAQILLGDHEFGVFLKNEITNT